MKFTEQALLLRKLNSSVTHDTHRTQPSLLSALNGEDVAGLHSGQKEAAVELLRAQISDHG